MLNRVILMGRITQDLELKTTASGIPVTSFSIAVDRNYVKQGEERQTDFINVVCWRKQAEFVCRYFEKGSMIAIEGQLQTRTYQAKDGSNRYVTEVVADSVSFTGEKREQSNNGYSQPQYQQPPQQSYQQPTQPQYQTPQYQQQQMSGYNGYPQPQDLQDEDLPF
ncbi:MAG: single-stranded DNA-binding protein [Ruminococcus sp.]|nr:single-stranded DNA-binding protein [Ruminococcus sp.]MCI5617988.1 single-stranded DNA-binding protein [Ruminococcus sp.]